jgi:hypothetical protein
LIFCPHQLRDENQYPQNIQKEKTMKKTGGIIATILTSLLCGLPGLALACLGLIGLLGTQLPGTASQTTKAFQDTMLGGAIFIGGGIILVIIPIGVAIVTLRNRRATLPTAPAYYAAPAQPAYTQPPSAYQPTPAPVQPVYVPSPMQAAQPPAAPAFDPTQDLYARLMALNRPTAPFRIMDGRAEGVDLIAEWKIVDAQWYEIFAKANLTKVFRIYLKLYPATREVRAMDREYTVQWRAGIPSLGAEASFFKGQKSSVSFGIGTGFTENLAPGVVYKYKFNTNELKQPIQQVIAASGWTYKGVAFGKL